MDPTNTSRIQSENISDPCSIDDETSFLEIRFYLIGIIGCIICSIGIIFNWMLLRILLQSSLRVTYLIYLSALSVMDINIAITYIVVMCIAIWNEYYTNYYLYYFWHICLPYFFTLSRIVTLASTYLIVACTLERYLEVVQLYNPSKYIHITQNKRYVVIILVILFSVIFRLVVFWELDVIIKNEICRGTLAYFDLRRTWLVENFYYSKIYSFYILHIVQVFFPFLVLLILNFLIVRKWRIVLRRDTVIFKNSNFFKFQVKNTTRVNPKPFSTQIQRDEIRKRVKCAQSARVMMFAIVTSYLLCNLLNLILTFLEHLDQDLLRAHAHFYSFASDTVTLLTAVNASVRLPIYYACNLKIRSEIVKLFHRYSYQEKWKEKNSDRNTEERQNWDQEEELEMCHQVQTGISEVTPLCNGSSRKSLHGECVV